MRFFVVLFISCLLLLGPIATRSAAQRVSSQIQGTVKDSAGAVIIGAQVTAINLETSVNRSTVTDGYGTYHFEGLPTGHYELKIKHTGFKIEKLSDITLLVNQIAVLDPNLEVGSTKEKEEVTIDATTPVVETTSAQMSSVVIMAALSELPLNGRDLFQLVELQTGISSSTHYEQHHVGRRRYQ